MIRGGTRTILFDRTGLLLVVFFVLAALIVARLFYLQIIKHAYFELIASGQYKIDKEILQSRGEIFMHDFKEQTLTPVVINQNVYLLYAVPSQIVDAQTTAKTLVDILEDPHAQCRQLLDEQAPEELIQQCEYRKALEEEIYNKLRKVNDPYEPLKHHVGETTANQIKALNLAGIYFEDEWIRFYPTTETTAHVSGFLGFQANRRTGQYGIEGYFEKELAGEKGQLLYNKDLYGQVIPVADQEIVEAKDGDNIILTLDKVIQNKAYEIIKQAVEDYGAEDGSLFVMDPQSGKIKAMVNYPSFDPNNYNQVEDIDIFRNLNISQAYEPGSIFKIVTMAAGIDSGAIQPNDIYEDKGYVQLGEHRIRNADNEKFGEITMTEVLENSVNCGAVWAVFEIGKETFRNYVYNFGFGSKTNIELSGETLGDISSLNKRGDIYIATASYGQGITITPIQMATAVSVIVNNGKLIQPRIVDYIEKDDGEIIQAQSSQAKEIIAPKSAAILKAMMVSVVKNGHGSKAQVPGYYIGGKTGTAEIAAEAGGYSDETIHSFVGFGPLEDTKFMIIVKLTKPQWGRFSAVTAAPTFQKMASFLLQYYQVAPEY